MQSKDRDQPASFRFPPLLVTTWVQSRPRNVLKYNLGKLWQFTNLKQGDFGMTPYTNHHSGEVAARSSWFTQVPRLRSVQMVAMQSKNAWTAGFEEETNYCCAPSASVPCVFQHIIWPSGMWYRSCRTSTKKNGQLRTDWWWMMSSMRSGAQFHTSNLRLWLGNLW